MTLRARQRRAVALAVVSGALAAVVAPSHAEGGAAAFRARCARCHGESGRTETQSARVLKVRPLVADSKLAQMTPAEIVAAVKANAKHQGVDALKDVDDAELRAAAAFVKTLAAKP